MLIYAALSGTDAGDDLLPAVGASTAFLALSAIPALAGARLVSPQRRTAVAFAVTLRDFAVAATLATQAFGIRASTVAGVYGVLMLSAGALATVTLRHRKHRATQQRAAVENVDIPGKCTRTRSKGGYIGWLFFGWGSARLSPLLIAGRPPGWVRSRTSGGVVGGGWSPIRAARRWALGAPGGEERCRGLALELGEPGVRPPAATIAGYLRLMRATTSMLLWASEEGGASATSLLDTTRPVAPRYLPVPRTTFPGLPSTTSIEEPNAWLTQLGGPAATNVQRRWSVPLGFLACLTWLPVKPSSWGWSCRALVSSLLGGGRGGRAIARGPRWCGA